MGASTSWTDIKRHAHWVALPFVVTRLLIYYVGWLSTLVVVHGKWWGAPARPIDLFLRWDVGWFRGIAYSGYQYTPGVESSVAFYPLYPLSVRALTLFGLSDVASGLLISNASLFVAAVLTSLLFARQYASESIGRTAALFLLVWPVSFFHSTLYSDALFLALFAGAMLAARSGRWLMAGALGMCLSATRTIGALAILPLALEAWGVGIAAEERPPRRGAFWLALVPMGAVLYALYLWHTFGDPLASVHVHKAWGRDMAGVVEAFRRARDYPRFYATIFTGAALYLLALTVLMAARRSRPSDVVWCAIVWWSAASSGSLESLPRICLMAPPIFGFVAAWSETRPTGRQMVLVTSAMLLGLMTILFANGYWMT
jgi:Mannosyltransferase (PIG-V)